MKMNTPWPYLLLGLLFWTPAYGAGEATIDQMKPGEWAIISNNFVDDLDPCNAPPCSYTQTGQQNIINAWNGGALVTSYGKLGGLAIWGGGHGGYSGTEIYMFDIETGMWVRITEPLPYSEENCINSPGDMGDGKTPCPPHTSDTLAYDPVSNALITLDSETAGGGGHRSGYAFHYDFDDQDWHKGGYRRGLTASLYQSGSAYDPKRQAIWVQPHFNQKFAKYDIASETWTLYNLFNIDVNTVGAISSTLDVFVLLDARHRHDLRVYDLSNPSAGPIQVSFSGDTAPVYDQSGGFEWDPVVEKFVWWDGNAGANVYTITPPSGDWRTGTWTFTRVPAAPTNTVTPVTPPIIINNGTWSRWRYVPSKNIYVVVQSTTGPVYAYKLSEGTLDHIAPTPPANLEVQ